MWKPWGNLGGVKGGSHIAEGDQCEGTKADTVCLGVCQGTCGKECERAGKHSAKRGIYIRLFFILSLYSEVKYCKDVRSK